jgi:hypothetical protein
MRRITRLVAGIALAACLAATSLPAGAITGGTDDTTGEHPNVGLLFFYQADGRFRCSATLIHPRVILTAAHCAFGDIGKVAVTFDAQVAADPLAGRDVLPRALDDPGTGLKGSGYTQGLYTVEYDAQGQPIPGSRAPYDNSGWDDGTADGAPVWITGTPLSHPEYSDFTDLDNWNDTGIVILDEPVTDLPTAELAPEGYLDQFAQKALIRETIRTVGYGTEVRSADSGPQKPTPQSYPLRRQYTDEKPQKLTDQILQLNGNEHDPFGGGGTCFGDSGGPGFHGGYLIGDTSYGYTSNCRYLGGYQRVDIPVVRDWLLCALQTVAPTGSAAHNERTPDARATVEACGTKA